MPELDEAWAQSLVCRVFKKGRVPIGTAFLLSDNHLFTCAHVVAAALSKPFDADIPLGTTIEVQQSAPGTSPFCVKVCYFVRYDPEGPAGDMAILEIPEDKRTFIGTVPFSIAKLETDSPVRVYGHAFHDGGWLKGQVAGRNMHGHIQIGKSTFNNPLDPGMSGSPVWKDSACIGMAALADKERGIGFIIPYRLIRQIAEAIDVVPSIAAQSDDEVCKALLNLDFEPQMKAWVQIASAEHSAGPMTGTEQDGHLVLAKRLVNDVRLEYPKITHVNLREAHTGSMAAFLDQLGHDLGVPSRQREQAANLRRAIMGRLRINDAIILVDTGERTPSDTIRVIFKEFWPALIADLESSGSPNRLLMLVIDKRNRGTLCDDGIAVDSCPPWTKKHLFAMPRLARVGREILQVWLGGPAALASAITLNLAADYLHIGSDEGTFEGLSSFYCKMRALNWGEIRKQCELE